VSVRAPLLKEDAIFPAAVEVPTLVFLSSDQPPLRRPIPPETGPYINPSLGS